MRKGTHSRRTELSVLALLTAAAVAVGVWFAGGTGDATTLSGDLRKIGMSQSEFDQRPDYLTGTGHSRAEIESAVAFKAAGLAGPTILDSAAPATPTRPGVGVLVPDSAGASGRESGWSVTEQSGR